VVEDWCDDALAGVFVPRETRAAESACPAATPPADAGLGVAGGCGEKPAAFEAGPGPQPQPTALGSPEREATPWSTL